MHLEQKQQQEIQVINFPALHNKCTNTTLFQEFVPFVGMSDTAAFQLVQNLRQEESVKGISVVAAGNWLSTLEA